MPPDRYHMSQQELQRVPVVQAVCTKQMTQVEAAHGLGLRTRQVRRLQHRFAQEGPQGLAHRARGRPSNARTPVARRTQALTLIRTRYPDFGPTLASEKLAELHGLDLSVESIRQLMIAAAYWQPRKGAGIRVHPMRERRAALSREAVIQILKDGAEVARAKAQAKMKIVREKIGVALY